jgi:hypothetical protein
MKINPLSSSLALAAVLAFGASAIAQHGGGRPAGAGAGSMGGPSGAGDGMGGRPSDVGPGGPSGMGNPNGMGNPSGMSGSSIRSQAPNTALSNPKLDSSLTNALGKSGITVPGGNLQSACSGFKNLGQCVAAMHVAKNLNLNFSDLQSQMTGPNSVNLGKAIQGLGGPNVNAKSEARKAGKQANHDLNAAASVANSAS